MECCPSSYSDYFVLWDWGSQMLDSVEVWVCTAAHEAAVARGKYQVSALSTIFPPCDVVRGIHCPTVKALPPSCRSVESALIPC